MKQKITLLVFVVLTSMFAFGQNRVHNLSKKQRLDSLILKESDTNTYKYEFGYDANGNRKVQFYIQWNSETQKWEYNDNASKEEYIYDANGNETSCIFSNFDGTTQEWINSSKYEYTYDANGKMTAHITSIFNSTTQEWIISYKYEFGYDANGKQTFKIFCFWNASTQDWDNYLKNEYSYDANGNLIVEASRKWNATTQEWEYAQYCFKYEYTYNADNKCIFETYSDWNASTQDWDYSFRWENGYDASGKPTFSAQSFWNSETQEWEYNGEADKYEYGFDANGNPILKIGSRWDATKKEWKNGLKYEYTYDLSFSLNDLLYPNGYTFMFSYSSLIVNKPLEWISYRNVDGNWVNYKRGTHYYSSVETSVSNVSLKNYKVYPNPVSDIVTIEIADGRNTFTFELYDIQGRKLISKEMTNNGQINLEGLAKGFYLYNLNMDGKTESGKLIKK